MIKINDEYYGLHAIKEDHVIFSINTDREDLNKVLSELIEHPNPSKIKMYKDYSEGDSYKLDMQEQYNPSRKIFDNDDITEFDDIFKKKDYGADIRKSFDDFYRGYHGHERDFTEVPFDEDIFLTEAMDALGIIPTIMNENDLSLSDKVKYSKEGRSLMWEDYTMGEVGRSGNPFPTREDIELFMSLNPYEKRLIKSGGTFIHPLSVLSDIRTMRQTFPGMTFTKEMYKTIERSRGRRISPETLLDTVRGTDIEHDQSDIFSYAVSEFTDKLGRAPRVLPEILSAINRRDGKVTKESVDRYISFYDRGDKRSSGRAFTNSISKIAGKHNAALFAMADKVNFAEMSNDMVDLYSVYMDIRKVNTFADKNFFPWTADKKPTTAEIIDIITGLDYEIDEWSGGMVREMFEEGNMISFNDALSVDDALYEIGQLIGKRDARMMETSPYYDFEQGYHFINNDIAIKGREIIVSDKNYTVLMLHPDDFRNFTVGYDTCCCQHYGGAGDTCVWHLTSDPYAANLVIVKNSQMKGDEWYKGPCIAQAYVWVDEQSSTVVLDNMEFRRVAEENFDHRVKEFVNVLSAWCEAMPYDNVHVGTGCNQGMAGFGKQAEKLAVLPHTLRGDAHIYSDYHGDARSLKKDGEIQLYPDMSEHVDIRHSIPVPSRFDFLRNKKVSWLASCSISLNEMRSLADKFLDNPDEETQFQAIELNPEAIKYIDHPAASVQRQIIEKHRELIPYINDPIPEITAIVIENDPAKILTMTNPPEELWKVAVTGNGLLYEKCPYEDEDIRLAAIGQNPLSIKFMKEPSYDIQMEAVHRMPETISFIMNPAEDAIKYVGEVNPMILNDTVLPKERQMEMVENNPKNVLDLKDPDYDVIMYAVSHDGMLIRPFRFKGDDLCMAAVKQNPFAIRFVSDPTEEMMKEAIRGNERAVKYLKIPVEEKRALVEAVRAENTVER